MSVFTKEQTEALKRHAEKHYVNVVFSNGSGVELGGRRMSKRIREYEGVVRFIDRANTKRPFTMDYADISRVLREATDEVTRAERDYDRRGNKASEPFTGWDDDE